MDKQSNVPSAYPSGYETLSDALEKERKAYDSAQQKRMVACGKATEDTQWREVDIGCDRHVMIPDYVPDPPPYDIGYDKELSKRQIKFPQDYPLTTIMLFGLGILLVIAFNDTWATLNFLMDVFAMEEEKMIAGFIVPFVVVMTPMILDIVMYTSRSKATHTARKAAYDDWYDKYILCSYTAYGTRHKR